MRNLLKITAIGLVFTLFSCGGLGAPDMNTKEGLDKIKSLAIEKFGEDLELYSFNILSGGDLNSNFGSLTGKYLKDGKRYTKQYYANSRKLMDEPDSKGFQNKMFLAKAQGKLKLSDLDTDRVISNIEKALELMGEGVNKYHLTSYTIEADPKTNAVTSTFEIHVTKKGEGTTLEGRNIVTNFYEANFTADSDGNVEMTN